MSGYRIIFAGLTLAVWPGFLSADTIKLESGGTVRGQILDEKSTKDYVLIKLLSGGELKIERKKIESIVREKSAVEEYNEINADYGETAEDQFKLAIWCEEHKLWRQRHEHLRKTIELDPDHAQAREKLGYIKRDGKWLTRNEQQEAKGLVRFEGRYVTPQEKQILEQKKREDGLVREWHQRVRMWKSQLTGNDPAKSRQAQDNLLGIEDPQALDALVGQFGKEPDESLRILMCEILGNLPGEEATLELVKRSIVDSSSEVRWAATEALVQREDPAAVRSLLRALQSEHNAVVRRAAEALGAIGDPTAVPALITALVTKHKQVVTRPGAPSMSLGGNTTPVVVDYEAIVGPGVVTYRPILGTQSSGFGVGGGVQQEVVIVPLENPEVLEALKSITKEDYGYSQTAWRQWFAGQKRKEEVKNRRQLEGR
jgi:hypothetical protein